MCSLPATVTSVIEWLSVFQAADHLFPRSSNGGFIDAACDGCNIGLYDSASLPGHKFPSAISQTTTDYVISPEDIKGRTSQMLADEGGTGTYFYVYGEKKM